MTKGDRTRQMILEKAAPLFNRKGYSGTAIADLMTATGLQKGGIYRHFSAKEELAADAFDYAWSVVSHPRFATLEKDGTVIERLKAMVAAFAERPAKHIPGGCPLLNTAIEADDTNPVLRSRAQAALAQWMEHIGAVVRQGIERNEINPRVDPHDVATLLIATLEGALMMSKLQRDRQPLERARAHLFEMITGLR